MTGDREARVAAVAALDEPTRRRLYEYVVRRGEPVSRDEAAEVVQLPRTTAAFHLDRLVEQGLLEITYERRTGRTGPGAGRPAKLYHRAECEVVVSVPERRYDLAGQLLAGALEDAERGSGRPLATLERRAYDWGKTLGEATRADHDLIGVLEAHGYEPRSDGDLISLINCPFHSLAKAHTDLVCGMNLQLLHGLLDGLAETGMRAELRPTPGRCCVRMTPHAPKNCQRR